MGDFHQKMLSESTQHHVQLHPDHVPTGHGHALVKTVGNHTLHLKASQIPSTNVHRNANIWRYPATGDLSTMISGGGQATIPIIRGTGSGHASELFLRLVITNNTGSGVRLVDMCHLIDNIEFQTPSGQQIQQLNSDELWLNLVRFYDDEQWKKIAKMINSNPRYGKGEVQPDSTIRTYYLPLIGNWIQNCGFFLPVIDGDIQCLVQFKPASATVVSGSAPTLTGLSLDVRMEQLHGGERVGRLQNYRRIPHHYYIAFPKRQQFSQAITAGTTYELNLSGIRGDVMWIDFFIRATESGDGYRKFAPISSFSLLNNEGDEISGQQDITSDFNRFILQSEYYPSSYSYDYPVYSYVFGADDHGPMSFIYHGERHGSYPFTTHERLRFTAGPAGTSEVQTATLSSGLAAADGGSWQIEWVTPNGSEYTEPFAYNESAANIKAAIESLSTFDGTITVSAALTATATPVNFTFGGNYAYMPMAARGYKLIVHSIDVNDGGVPGGAVMSVSTAGVEGLNTGGTHTITVIAWTSALLKQDKGNLEVRYT